MAWLTAVCCLVRNARGQLKEVMDDQSCILTYYAFFGVDRWRNGRLQLPRCYPLHGVSSCLKRQGHIGRIEDSICAPLTKLIFCVSGQASRLRPQMS